MQSLNGVYENGQIRLEKPIPFIKRAKVIVTIVEEIETMEGEQEEADIDLFDDLIGAVNARENGSQNKGQISK
jgi:hypothetical protein